MMEPPKDTPPGSHGTCTVTFAGTGTPGAVTGVVEEITPATLDVHSIKLGQSVTGGGTLTTTSVTTTATDYAFSFAVDAAGTGGSPTVASPFTVRDNNASFGISDADFTQSGAGAGYRDVDNFLHDNRRSGGNDDVESTTGAASLVILRWAAIPAPSGPRRHLHSNPPPPTTTTAAAWLAPRRARRQSPFRPPPGAPSPTIHLHRRSTTLQPMHFTSATIKDSCTSSPASLRGTPAEFVSTTGPNLWPANLDAGYFLRSPVFDDGSNQVFVTDSVGILYRVDSTIGSGNCQNTLLAGCKFTSKVADIGFEDGPLVDTTTDTVYVFARGDMGGGGNGNAAERAAVFQFASNFPYNAGGTEVAVASDNTPPVSAFYAGDFDNAYFNSTDGTGNMYVAAPTPD